MGLYLIEDDALHTILAALRTYQEAGYGDPMNRPDRIHDIASNCGDDSIITLDDEGIDRLCEGMNVVTTDADDALTLIDLILTQGEKYNDKVIANGGRIGPNDYRYFVSVTIAIRAELRKIMPKRADGHADSAAPHSVAGQADSR